jgi:hypothetical protein
MGFMASCILMYPLLSTGWLENTKRRYTHDVYITKFVEPKVINRVGRGHKVTFAELLVGLRGSDVELVKNPFLDETLVASGLFVTRGRERQENYNLVYFKDGRDKLWVWVRI